MVERTDVSNASAAPIFDFREMRSDWYEGGDLMSRALRQSVMARWNGEAGRTFRSFPRQWIPIFEWLGVDWEASSDPASFIPFISGLSETQIVEETKRARSAGQLRLLVEVIASADTVLGEALQRLDALQIAPRSTPQDSKDCSSPIRLTNWYAYTRPEIREYEEDLLTFRPTQPDAIFLPCGRKRPYHTSRTHKRMAGLLESRGLDPAHHDLIVVTSLGPVPEALWNHPAVARYDTSVRDVYRMLVLFRRMLKGHHYRTGVDCLGFRPYRDLLSVLRCEGFIERLARPTGIRGRSIPTYR